MAPERSNGEAAGGEVPGGQTRAVQANAAITHLRRAVQQGEPWYPALLDAIGLWEEPRERFRGDDLEYLVAGEALDFLLLAGRLCREVEDLIPHEELAALLFEGEPPTVLPAGEFRERIGPLKYRCFLNFFYGITVEEALFFVHEEEARRHRVVPNSRFDLDVVYQDLYGASEAELLGDFLNRRLGSTPSLDVQQLKAFTYFLFKRRLAYCLPPRVASDTKRGLAELRRQYEAAGRDSAYAGRPDGLFEEGEVAPAAEVASA